MSSPYRPVLRRGDDQPHTSAGLGVKGNTRLTSSLGAILIVLLAAEGLTLLQVHQLLTWHVVLGMLLVPPVVLKIGVTSWRFAKYYLGDNDYRQKGPPFILLRLLGPFVVILTVTLLGSGVVALLAPAGSRSLYLTIHKASFVLWFGCMTIHVLGHLGETFRHGASDLWRRSRRWVPGAYVRLAAVALSVVLGVALGVAFIPQAHAWVR